MKNLKIKDKLDIGFKGLGAEIIKVKKNYLLLKTTSAGALEKNQGVHLKKQAN